MDEDHKQQKPVNSNNSPAVTGGKRKRHRHKKPALATPTTDPVSLGAQIRAELAALEQPSTPAATTGKPSVSTPAASSRPASSTSKSPATSTHHPDPSPTKPQAKSTPKPTTAKSQAKPSSSSASSDKASTATAPPPTPKAKASASPTPKAKATSTSDRYLPPLTAGPLDAKAAAPTFSLQDIQRSQRRRNLLLGIAAAIALFLLFLFWTRPGQHQTPTNELSHSPAPTHTVASGQKVTLSGFVSTDGLALASNDRIAIYVRRNDDSEFADTGIRLVAGESEWRFSQADDAQSYDVQAAWLSGGRVLAYSNTSTVTAPAASINLVFATALPATSVPVVTVDGWDQPVVSTPVHVTTVGTPPVITAPSTANTLSGTILIHGHHPQTGTVTLEVTDLTLAKGQPNYYSTIYEYASDADQINFRLPELPTGHEFSLMVQLFDGNHITVSGRSGLTTTVPDNQVALHIY